MFESSTVKAVIFDLDGTLVETEHLKAEAYAELIGDLTGRNSSESAAIELYRSIVGATDLIACDAMIERFNLLPLLEAAPGEQPRETLHRLRTAVYRDRYGTPEKLATLVYPHNMALVRQAHREGLPIAVATMSFSDEAVRVIEAIGLSDMVHTVVGVEHVTNPKPAPDAFLLAMERLGVHPANTLIIEDSPRGSQAAANSGARWICVATEFSTNALRTESDLDADWIVWDPADLPGVIARRIYP